MRELSNFAGFEPDHPPLRPSWKCSTCGEEWPCEPARSRLWIETRGGTALAILMWNYLEDFCRDSAPGPVGEAFDRFMRWTR